MINYTYLRPKKAKILEEWHNIDFKFRNDLSANEYKNATILPLKKVAGDNLLFGRGGVIDSEKNYINSSAIDGRIQFSYEFENAEYQNKKVVYCGYLVNHWGHFLVEAVSRIWYCLKNDISVDEYVFFYNYNENHELKGNYNEFFELLGILDKIKIINKPTTYREVIVPELAYKRRKYYSQEYKDIFDTIVSNVKDVDITPSEKIFLTRSQLKNAIKKEPGIEMIDDFFYKNGYKIISPEKISLSQLILYIRNAKKCAAVSGTLPHNMLFGSDNQELIIVERNVLNNEIQADLNLIKNLDVTYIDANLAVYPINLGQGPFVLSYLGKLQVFAKDNGYVPPNKKYYTDKYIKKSFKLYMKFYRRYYQYTWFEMDWMIEYTDYIYEAYKDSLNYFGDYLYGIKPFKFQHYFQIKHIKGSIKRFIKKIIRYNK